MASGDDSILTPVRAALDRLYGDRIERIVLFGLRARGEAREDSDCDIVVFLENIRSLGEELERISSRSTVILLDAGAVLSAKPFRPAAYREQTGFMHELRRDGVDV